MEEVKYGIYNLFSTNCVRHKLPKLSQNSYHAKTIVLGYFLLFRQLFHCEISRHCLAGDMSHSLESLQVYTFKIQYFQSLERPFCKLM